MNKRALLLVIAIIVTITACIKEKEDIIPKTKDKQEDSAVVVQPPIDTSGVDSTSKGIIVTGIDDIFVDLYGSKIVDLNVKCDSCNGEELFVSLEGKNIPNNLEIIFTQTKGLSGFKTKLIVKSYFAKPGTYDITINATNNNGITSSYKQKIVINTPTKWECNNFFMIGLDDGTFDETWLLKTNSTKVDSLIPTAPGVLHNTQESNLYLNGLVLGWNDFYGRYYRSWKTISYHVLMNFDCYTGKLDIPEQTIEGRVLNNINNFFTVSGEGELNLANKTVDITYTSRYKENNSTVLHTFKIIAKLKIL